MTIDEFVKKHCTGKEYDSCVDSPCPYSSASGCRHPLHPKNKNLIIPTEFVVYRGNFKGLKAKITAIDPQKVYSYNDRGFKE
ncbi:MAG: hypothetical protein PWQ82_1163 [Thermosediminibacterales bacterium]|nr:hypothetical protein [Thermosediminibacterales bacterium]